MAANGSWKVWVDVLHLVPGSGSATPAWASQSHWLPRCREPYLIFSCEGHLRVCSSGGLRRQSGVLDTRPGPARPDTLTTLRKPEINCAVRMFGLYAFASGQCGARP